MNKHLLPVLAGLWAVCMVLSLLLPAITPPSDFGLTAGMNRITMFLGWQAAALALGVLTAGAYLSRPKPRTMGETWMGLPPLAMSLLVVVTLVGLVLYLRFAPDPQPDPSQTTSPPATTKPAEPLTNG